MLRTRWPLIVMSHAEARSFPFSGRPLVSAVARLLRTCRRSNSGLCLLRVAGAQEGCGGVSVCGSGGRVGSSGRGRGWERCCDSVRGEPSFLQQKPVSIPASCPLLSAFCSRLELAPFLPSCAALGCRSAPPWASAALDATTRSALCVRAPVHSTCGPDRRGGAAALGPPRPHGESSQPHEHEP